MSKAAKPQTTVSNAQRLEGHLTGWNGARGFGFLRPIDGSPDAFAHISAFAKDDRHIEEGHLYTYEVTKDSSGRIRAKDIRPTKTEITALAKGTPGLWMQILARSPHILVIPAFLFIVYAISTQTIISPKWLEIYGIASVACFIGYGIDKRAAQKREWRISETVLILLGLVGGWPGAILAQEFFRHKTKKPRFRTLFWMSVIINIAAFVQINLYPSA